MQFTKLWELLQSVQIDVNNTDSITCKLTNNGFCFVQVGLHHAIFGSHQISLAVLSVKTMSTSQMQDLCLVDHLK
jgi:hypothetical protein